MNHVRVHLPMLQGRRSASVRGLRAAISTHGVTSGARRREFAPPWKSMDNRSGNATLATDEALEDLIVTIKLHFPQKVRQGKQISERAFRNSQAWY